MRIYQKKILFYYFIVSLFLVIIFLPIMVIAVEKEELLNLNDKISEQKDKLDEVENKLDLYKTKIEEAHSQSITLKNQIELINNRITKTELEIEESEIIISKLELEILSLNKEILDSQKKIDVEREMVAYYLRELQRMGDRSPLEIILLNTSFSKFFKELKYFEDLQDNLNRSIDNLRKSKQELESRQKELQENKNEVVETKNNLEDKKERLDSQKVAKSFLIGQTFASESKFQALLLETKKEQEELDADINRLETEIRKKLQQNDLFPYGGDVVLTWPVPKNRITAYFHDSDYPYKYLFEHSGLDIRATQGTTLKAPAPGYVLKVRNQNDWRIYNYIVLVHSGGISTIYLHLSDVYIKPDTYVARGEVIGKTGGTPRTRGAGLFTTGAHLHFEVRQNGIPVNPLNYLVDL